MHLFIRNTLGCFIASEGVSFLNAFFTHVLFNNLFMRYKEFEKILL